MNNQTDVSIKFSNYVTGEKKLERYAETLTKIQSVLAGIDTGTVKQLEESAKNTKEIAQNTKQQKDIVQKAFNYTMIREFSRGLQRIAKEMSRLSSLSMDYLENINLFQVAFNGTYDSATKFVNKMSEMYGLDENWLTRTVGIFKQLSNAMGLSAETGERLSTLLTQMSLDISSLYNVDMERASSTLQSALAGQTKPIRGTTGADITQATLQTTLDNLGIDRTVNSLSFAEKRLLIIISLTEQLNASIGDMGRTIESPANQMRVLSSQWDRLSRAVGNVFLPILAEVLPYLNAILMVLTEIISGIATLVGYNEEDYDYFAGTADSVLDLEAGLEGATESAKKLKSGLRGFDKLNVIKTPSDSGSSSTPGGINPDIMDAFNDAFDKYQEKLDNVEMKATRIRDAIMDWLGFTKEIDKVTGDVSFKFEKLTSGTVLGALATGGAIYTGVYLISQFLAKIGIISKGLPSLFSLLSSAVTAIATALGISAGWVVAIGIAIGALVLLIIQYWDEIQAFVVDLWDTISNFFVDLWNDINENFVKPIIDFFTTLADFIYKNVIEPVISFFKPIVEAIVEIFTLIVTKVAEIVVGIGKAVWSIITKVGEIFLKIVEIFLALGKAFYDYIITPIFNFFVDVATWVYDKFIKPFINGIIDLATSVYDKFIKPFFDWVVWLKDKAVEIFKKIGTTVISFLSDTFKGVINGILSVIEGSINNFIKLLNGAIDIINNIPGVSITKVDLLKIPRLEKGMDFVPKDYFGPVYLDYGERVLTKEQNRDYITNQQKGQDINARTSFSPTFIIQVGDEEVARKVLNDMQDMARSDGKPIVIGG